MKFPIQVKNYWSKHCDEKHHHNALHPIGIISHEIKCLLSDYQCFEDYSPVVTVQDNFDYLLIDENHPSRSPNDTYYCTDDTVLRTHTSAHQVDILKRGYEKFVVIGDVYRRDTVDTSHYPVFHQIEGVNLCDNPLDDLKYTLENVVNHLFGDLPFRYDDAHFPFTDPSLEISVLWNNKWVEILGAGKIHPNVLENAGIEGKEGWAFGMGLERLAMLAFDIPDIRLFWTEDERFHKQFVDGKIVKFQSYSDYPPCYKDVAFWIDIDNEFVENNFHEIVREQGGNLVEDITLIDAFIHPNSQRKSKCFRVTYRSLERTLTDAEVNAIQQNVRDKIENELPITLR